MNSSIIKTNFEKNENQPLLNGDYLAATVSTDDLPQYTRAIAEAFGLTLAEEEKDELDDVMDDLGVKNPKKQKSGKLN